MLTSILDPLCCGFAKVAMLQIKSEISSNFSKNASVVEVSLSLGSQYQLFKSEFQSFDIDYEWYRRNVNRIRDSLQSLGKRSAETKGKIVTCFSREKWNKVLSKEKHSIFYCKECLRSDKLRPILSLFPINKKDNRARKKAEDAGLFRPPIEDRIQSSLERLNEEFKCDYDKSFEEVTFELKRKFKRKEERCVLKKAKENIESQWRETSVLRYQTFN